MSETTDGCAKCNKSTLSLLLLRPSPISIREPLIPPGSKDVQTDEGLISGLVPARRPTESRYVLRMLRQGYVHVYIPSPPAGVKPWVVFRVTPGSDLVPENSEWFHQPEAPVSCGTKGHNAMGMKLLNLPQAHLLDTIWVAYSHNLWNDKLRAQNAANPKVMQQVSLLECGRHAFTPTTQDLKKLVLECALPELQMSGAKEQDFPFNSVAGEVDNLVKQMERAAACHPKTRGKQLAVVLPDPAGCAIELNALRLRRNDLMEQFLLEQRQPIEVNKVIHMLRNNVVASAEEEGLRHAVPLQSKEAFDQSRNYPPGTRWQGLTAEERAWQKERFEDEDNDNITWLGRLVARDAFNRLSAQNVGRVIYPDYEARVHQWADKQAKEDWQKFQEFYDEGKRAAWESTFQKTLDQEHLQQLKRFEEDWDGALKDPLLDTYFKRHFDEGATNTPAEVAKTGCCAGEMYTREAYKAFTPEPVTEAARATFEAQLDADVSKPEAYLVRALFANQKTLWETLESSSGKRDKTYDFMKGLIGEFENIKTANGATMPPSTAKRLHWLTTANMGFALGILGTLGAVAMQGTAQWLNGLSPSAPKPPDAKMMARMRRCQQMALIHRACEEAIVAAQGGKASVPVLLMANMDVDTFVQLRRARGELPTMREIRGLARKGQVTMAILTDSHTLANLRAAPDKAMMHLAADTRNLIRINEQAASLKASVAKGAGSVGAMLTLPVSRFLPLYEKQILTVASAPNHFKTWLSGLAKSAKSVGEKVAANAAAKDTAETALSTDGRLAIGTMVVQSFGAFNGLMDYLESKDADKSIDALLAMSDGIAGMLGGAAEFGAKWMEVRLGEELAKASARLALLRAVAAGMGVAGNAINAWMALRESAKLSAKGRTNAALVTANARLLFMVGAVPLTIQLFHELMLVAIRRGATHLFLGAAERRLGQFVGRTVAIRLGGALVGLTVPGIGWFITMVAVAETMCVVVTAPTPVQTWLKYCYFGKPGWGESTRKSWEEENRAWQEFEKEAREEHEKAEKKKAERKRALEDKANAK